MRIRSAFFKKEFDLSKAEMIGSGNFAQVFRIYDSGFGDSLAIRKVKKNQADLEDIKKQKQINDELRRVDNQNILKIFDIIDQPQNVWYITEYCAGGSLWDALNLCKNNKMNEKECLECVLQISKGIQELHNHRITHRDLKPQNILLKTKYVAGKPLPVIKLADFGLSTQKIIMETIAGTKQYIAPQQAKFHNYTNAVDVWSLGIIFDEMLHGTPFYCGDDNKEVFDKILKLPYKIRDQTISPQIKDLLTTLLKKKPYQRPIIAVIRATIQKIIAQQQNESLQIKKQFNFKKTSSIVNPQTTRYPQRQKNSVSKQKQVQKLSKPKQKKEQMVRSYQNSTRESPSKDNIMQVYNRKTYQTNYKNIEENTTTTKVKHEYLSKDVSPIYMKPKPYFVNNKEDIFKNNSIILSQSVVKQNQKSIMSIQSIKSLKEKNQITSRAINNSDRSNKNDQSNRGFASPRTTQTNSESYNNMLFINDKITIYRAERRKPVIPPKKQQLKEQIVNLHLYSQGIYVKKRKLLDHALRIQRQIRFLPNLVMTGSDFGQTRQQTSLILKQFKQKMNYLNYFVNTQDYRIKIANGQTQLKNRKHKAQSQLKALQKQIKDIFFNQMDKYIDGYIQKILK